jgi:hypothetical protein
VPFTLLNWTFAPIGDQGSGLAFSAGAGAVINNGGGNKGDLIAGLSLVVKRAVVFTVGGTLGTKTMLSPGYTVGGLIPSGQTPPTAISSTTGLFAGVSFGVSK